MATTIWYSNPSSGNAMDFTDSNQWNTATDGSGTAGNPDSTDDKAVIQNGDTVTLDANVTVGQVSIESGGTLTGNTSFSLTLAGSDQDNNYNNSGSVTNLNLIITGIRASGDRTFVDVGSGLRDLTLNDTTNSGNNVHIFGNNLAISGNLTITAGTLDTLNVVGGYYNLDVAGDILIQNGGTLTANTSLVEARSLTVDSGGTYNATSAVTKIQGSRAADAYGLDLKDGTVNHNAGTFRYEGSGGTLLNFADTHIYNLELNVTGSSGSAITLHGDASNSVTINNDFTIENASGQGLLVPLGADGYAFNVGGNMYMKYLDRSTSENLQFGYNQTASGTWTIEGTLAILNANEHVRIRATSGTFNLGGLINDGGRIDSQ
jgi:hypothetical protein